MTHSDGNTIVETETFGTYAYGFAWFAWVRSRLFHQELQASDRYHSPALQWGIDNETWLLQASVQGFNPYYRYVK